MVWLLRVVASRKATKLKDLKRRPSGRRFLVLGDAIARGQGNTEIVKQATYIASLRILLSGRNNGEKVATTGRLSF